MILGGGEWHYLSSEIGWHAIDMSKKVVVKKEDGKEMILKTQKRLQRLSEPL